MIDNVYQGNAVYNASTHCDTTGSDPRKSGDRKMREHS